MNKEKLSVCCFPLEHSENAVMDLIYGPVRKLNIELRAYDWFLSNFKKADIFDVHWPDAVVMGQSTPKAIAKIGALLLSVFMFRLRGVKIVYHVHNIGSHDKYHPALERFFWSVFIPRVDLFIHMNSASEQKFKQVFANARQSRHEVIFLPHYKETVEIPKASRAVVREKYGLKDSSHVYLCFGLLRPYKGLEALIEAFEELIGEAAADGELLIAGRPFDQAYGNELERLVTGNPRIKLMKRFVTDAELNELLYACDTVVMAHKKVNNSGIALMALSANRKLIAPELGALPELARIVGPQWVTLFGEFGVDVLREDYEKMELEEAAQPDLGDFEPRLLGQKLVDAYQRLAERD